MVFKKKIIIINHDFGILSNYIAVGFVCQYTPNTIHIICHCKS